MDSLALKNAIVRAAVDWERKRAEKLAPNQYREMGAEEDTLAEAVRNYQKRLLEVDTDTSVIE